MKYIALGAAFIVLAAAALIYLREKTLGKRRSLEQVDRKMKEDALDRALSNGKLRTSPQQAQAPVEIHYNSKPKKESGLMIHLTEQAESISKEYLFRQTEVIYIGEEYGRSAIFREHGNGRLYCQLFPYQDGVCIRLCGRDSSRLIRGKQTTYLTSKAIRLRSGDRIETPTGIFLVELIQ